MNSKMNLDCEEAEKVMECKSEVGWEEKKKALASNKVKGDDQVGAAQVQDDVVSVSGDDVWLKKKTPSCCKHCGKEFSSVKALGAHMRVHNYRHLSAANIRSGGGKRYLVDLVKDGKPTCSICNKTFLSLKSLFGHMRCHPERRYRGMLPPNHNNNNNNNHNHNHLAAPAPTTSPFHHIHDLVQCLPSWPVKDKRGRKSLFMGYDDDDDDDDEMLYSAVHGLMMLQAAAAATSNTHHQNENVVNKDLDYEHMDYNNSTPLILAASVRCYKCATCDKSFASPQALGGHRSSAHNKIFINNTTVVCSGGRGLEEFGDEEDHMNTTRAGGLALHPPQHQHVCRTCDKVFPSGQALGGHQRCHWQPPISSSSSSSPAPALITMTLCDDQSASATKEAGPLDFDLNQVPNDDQQEDASNCNGTL